MFPAHLTQPTRPASDQSIGRGAPDLTPADTSGPPFSPQARSFWVSRNVVYLGLTSLFTDLSSEMVSTVLPIYLVFALRFTPLEFGIVDGLYHGVAAFVRLWSGLLVDHRRCYKQVAAVGYGLSAACKLALVVAGNVWLPLVGILLLDRTGKGIRTAPRDALISLSSPRAALATAFGVHRALDTAGAVLGPLIAFSLLALVPGAFDVIWVVSFCAALIGLGVLVLFVENRPPGRGAGVPGTVSLRAAFGLLCGPRFRMLDLVVAALSLMTISDGFLYLVLQRRLAFNVGVFPLLFLGTALAYLVLAAPVGRLADWIGRQRVFLSGYVLLLGVYLVVLVPTIGTLNLIICLLLFGAYYAATDGVLMALVSAILPADLRTTGLALLTTVTSLARLLASVLFGALWTWRGTETAVALFVVGLVAALLLAAIGLVRTQKSIGRA